MLDPAHFLCENCGYQLDGLGLSANCPECGRPLKESHSDNRVGTPWQQRLGFGGWLRTLRLTAMHPRAMWDRVQVESRRSMVLLLVNLGVAALIVTVGIMIPGKSIKHAGPVYGVLFFVVVFDILLVLTLIESVGIRTFAKRRKWRTTRAVADAICGHAAAGWILSGIGVALAWHLAQRVDSMKVAAWIRGVRGPSYVPDRELLEGSILIGLMFAGLLAGLLAFEFLVYFGFTRMRFANAARGATVSVPETKSDPVCRPTS